MPNNGLGFTIRFLAKKESAELDDLIKKLGITKNQIDSIQKRVSAKKGETTVVKYRDGVRKVTAELDKTNNVLKQTSTLTNKAFDFGKLLSYFNVLKMVFNKTMEFFKAAADYNETLEKFYVSMGSSAPDAMKFQNTLANAIGTSTADMMNFQSNFRNIMAGLGDISSKEAERVSESLTKMSLDYSSLFNVSQDVASKKFQAALVGQIMPIRRDSGYDVSKNAVANRAAELGIDKSYAQLSETEKRLIRILLLMEQMKRTGAFGDLARTIESPSNQLKVLNNQLQELKVWLGNVFIGTIGAILPYINGFVMALKEIVKLFAFFVGFTMPSAGTAEFFEDVEDYSIGIGDGIGAAANNAKELKKQLQGFDALNVITTPTQSSGGGGGGGAGLDTVSPALLDALGEYDSMMENVRMKATDIRDRLLDWLGLYSDDGGLTWQLKEGYTNLEKIWDILKLIGITIAGYKVAKGVLDFFNLLSGGVLDGADIKVSALSIGFMIAGFYFMYKGIKTAIDQGGFSAESLVKIAGGTGLTVMGAGKLLKISTGATLSVALPLVFDIVVAFSIVQWWNQYFEEQKEEIYADKKELNFGEMLNVGLSSIGEGFNENVIEKIFGEGALDGIIMKVADMRNAIDNYGNSCEEAGKKVGEWLVPKIIDLISTGVRIKNWWTNDVAPWFTKEKWQELGENIKKGLEEAWNSFVEWWNNSTLVVWFNEKVLPWFTKEKWQELGNTAVTNLKTWFDDFKNRFNPLKEWWDNKVAPWFTWEKWRNLAQNAWNSLASVFNGGSFHINLPHFSWTTQSVGGWVADVLRALNLPASLPKLNISWYAQGGLPDVGELFMAREAGPELVGSIGGQSAVMNNQQIVQAVSQGVAQAVSQVMGNGGNKYQLFIDGQQITDVVERRVGRNANLYGT